MTDRRVPDCRGTECQVRLCDAAFALSIRSATFTVDTEPVWAARRAASIFDFTRRAASAASLVWVRPVLI